MFKNFFKRKKTPEFDFSYLTIKPRTDGFTPSNIMKSLRLPANSINIPEYLFEYGGVLRDAHVMRFRRLRRNQEFNHPLNIALIEKPNPVLLKKRTSGRLGNKYKYYPNIIVKEKSHDTRTAGKHKKY